MSDLRSEMRKGATVAARMDHFVPARTRIGAGFLDRYLPPQAENVVSACAEALTLPGDLILDPFCQSPAVVLGAVASGRRVLASSPNPIDAFAVRQILNPLPTRQLNAAATRLGETVRGGALLRDHIQNLYRCRCPSCHRMAVADYFVWNMGQDEPQEKYVRCEGCGFEGLLGTDDEDKAVLKQIEEKGLTYFFALDRMATAGDAARHEGENLLKSYTHRARYALAQMIMKIEAEFAKSPEEDALKYLILACMVRCALFNRPPATDDGTARPDSNLGLERNVWLVFEEAWAEWRAQPPPPEGLKPSALAGQEAIQQLLHEKGDCNAAVIHCPVRDLARVLPVQSVRLIVTGLSNSSQRYWRLCFLWSGWLFGRDAAASLRPLVLQPIPDWAWYVRTLGASFRALRPKLHLHGHLAFLLSPRRSTQTEAAQMAAALAGMKFVSLVYGPESVAEASQGSGGCRILFTKGAEMMDGVTRPPDPSLLRRELKEEAERGALEVVAARGEPLPAGWLRNAAFARLSVRGSLQRAMIHQEEGSSGYDLVRKMVDEALGKEAKAPFSSLEWEARFAADATIPMLWPQQPIEAEAPLADRVEMAAFQILRDALMLRREGCEDALYRQFPGLLTPERDLVEACMASYCEEATPGYIRLRVEDQPERVRLASGQVVAELEALGKRMGLGVIRDRAPYHVAWIASGATHAFLFASTAAISSLAPFGPPEEGVTRYLVVPESRLALFRLKLRRSPIYGRILQQGDWTLILQPHIQTLLKAPQVDIHSLKQIVGLDPIIEQHEAQIPLF
jgi:hypothetical protein